MRKNTIGKQVYKLPGYYVKRGFGGTLRFEKPIDTDYRKRHNQIGHWINQSYLIRLHAFLEYHKFTGNWRINHDSPGSIELDLLRRLRQIFAHSDGKYNPNNNRHVTLWNRLIEHFNVPFDKKEIVKDDFPIPIKLVIEPITKACIEYVKHNYDNEPILVEDQSLQ